jgi:hypothetical protein
MKQTILIIVIVLAVIGVGFLLFKYGNVPTQGSELAAAPDDHDLTQNMQKAGLDQLPAEGTVLHIHQHLDIIINGEKKEVPGQIGIGSSFFSTIHTHDSSGVIHVESPTQKDFKLGEFFDEWGVKFNDNCIADFCSDSKHKLVVGVNGSAITNVHDYVLKAHDEIEVWYGDKATNPELIPSYAFPSGE